jgi:hypothetical protein
MLSPGPTASATLRLFGERDMNYVKEASESCPTALPRERPGGAAGAAGEIDQNMLLGDGSTDVASALIESPRCTRIVAAIAETMTTTASARRGPTEGARGARRAATADMAILL